MIIEHNINGIDIDPRAAQIAGLSLWLRAQKAWQAMGLQPADRPRVRKSNIVCAEPMPGEKHLLAEFVQREFQAAERPAFLGLLETVFDKMQLAGEAGSLLKIEEEIREAIASAKQQWKEGPKLTQATLFDEPKPNSIEQQRIAHDLSGITDEKFWEHAEDRIYTALKDYSEHSESGGFQRRLFAEDAARGFAFIDVCRKRYDVVVMNPPFGEYQENVRSYYYSSFPSSKNDLIGMFIERSLDLSRGGFVGAISSRTLFFLTTFEPIRAARFLANDPTFLIADLGKDVMDNAMVEAAAYCLASESSIHINSIFIRALNPEDRDDHVRKSVLNLVTGVCSDKLYIKNLKMFSEMENSPFCYWASPAVISLFRKCERLESGTRKVRVGLQTGDDFRYIRTWWEIPSSGRGWIPHPKGGETMRFAADVHLCVHWINDGKEIRSDSRARVQNVPFYFSPGITSSYRCLYYSPAIFPAGMITGVAGSAIYSSAEDIWWLLGVGNSRAFDSLIKLRLGSSEAGIIQVGHLQASPVPSPNPETKVCLETLARDGWRTQLTSFRQNEIAWNFVCISCREKIDDNRLESLLRKIDTVTAEAYGIPEGEFFALARGNSALTECVDLLPVSEEHRIHYGLGCAFGRWDVRFATGERQPPELPDPFAPLPVCPPGMLQNPAGLPARPEDMPASYPISIPWDGILVDDENNASDIITRVREVLGVIWQDRSDAIEQEACSILGVKSLRDYFRRPAAFFADHLKRYSKSRRQAPIYWPLSTASGSYTLWVYYHRLDNDTLYKCLQNFLEPKMREVEQEIRRLRTLLTNNEGGPKERDRAEAHEAFLAELRDMHEILSHWAPRWKPNLNDGVIITACPLWKLFRLPKWRKDLEACWKKLDAGDYDWAHLAFTLWPDRVREKCKRDRSLAIAHNLEDICEIQAPAAKKSAKKTNNQDSDT